MTRYLILNLSATTVIVALSFVIRSFIFWKIINPFDWIISLPTYQSHTRALILFIYISYHGILYNINEMRKLKS